MWRILCVFIYSCKLQSSWIYVSYVAISFQNKNPNILAKRIKSIDTGIKLTRGDSGIKTLAS